MAFRPPLSRRARSIRSSMRFCSGSRGPLPAARFGSEDPRSTLTLALLHLRLELVVIDHCRRTSCSTSFTVDSTAMNDRGKNTASTFKAGIGRYDGPWDDSDRTQLPRLPRSSRTRIRATSFSKRAWFSSRRTRCSRTFPIVACKTRMSSRTG